MGRILSILFGAFVLTACVLTPTADPAVRLVVDPAVVGLSDVKFRGLTQALRGISPEEASLSGNAMQVLSANGREALALERDPAPLGQEDCRPIGFTVDPIAVIEGKLADHSIVIVNEDHFTTRHRAFTEDLSELLAGHGFNYFAAEAFANIPVWRENIPEEEVWSPENRLVDSRPEEHFFRHGDGTYTGEAQFGRLGRTVKRLGYRLIPYEHLTRPGEERPADQAERINQRDEAQANNLIAAVFEKDPSAKVLIHVGNAHAAEKPILGGKAKMMAQRLKEKTGIDPLTIDQVGCRVGQQNIQFALSSGIESGHYDLQVTRPLPRFVRGRPAWRLERGDQLIDIPRELLVGSTGWRIIEARPIGEPDESVPMDTVAVWKEEEDIALLLPPGDYTVRAIDIER